MANDGQERRDLVVIGASAGGVETLRRVVAGLPQDLPAAICVVLHVAPDSPSALASILHRAGPLPCHPAHDGESLQPGRILVAPPDHHLVVEDRHVRLTVGPRENGHRPAVDVLFRSAAAAGDGRVVGVVLSGTRDDGTAGLAVIKSRGGATIVQDPADALYAGMPASALEHVTVDAVVPVERLATAVAEMVSGSVTPPDPSGPEPPVGGGGLSPDETQGRAVESAASRGGNPGHHLAEEQGVTTICPECGGVLSERSEAGMTQWECRVGHRYSPQSLADAQAQDVESALWSAVRALEDRSMLLRRMAERAESGGQPRSARSFRRRADAASDHAGLVREALSAAATSALRRLGDDPSAEEETAA